MAYVNQDEKKVLSVNIKKVLKKYGMKGSIGIRHHSTLVVKIKSGKLDVIGNWFNKVTEYGNTNRYGDVITRPEYLDVNEYWIDDGYSGEVKDFLNELLAAMKGDNWFNHSDMQTDYFHLKHYTDIKIGTWDRPYILEV